MPRIVGTKVHSLVEKNGRLRLVNKPFSSEEPGIN